MTFEPISNVVEKILQTNLHLTRLTENLKFYDGFRKVDTTYQNDVTIFKHVVQGMKLLCKNHHFINFSKLSFEENVV